MERCPEDGSLLYVLGSEGASQRPWEPEDIIAEKYRLIAPLHRRSGAGQSWRAAQLKLEREVELRILPPDTLQQPSDQARFEREVAAWARLRSRHLARLYDAAFTERGEPYIALEFSPHGSLGEVLASGHRLPLDELPSLAETLLLALAAAHETMVLHRDVNPHAVLLYAEPDGSLRYRLTGFGLAKQLDLDDDPTAITMTGQVLGDPAYMAPETIMSGLLEPRTDLYALGVTLFEALAGRRPFVGHSLSEMLAAHIQREAPDLRALRPEIPEPLSAFVARLLAKEPEERFRDTTAALAALRQLPPESFIPAGLTTDLELDEEPESPMMMRNFLNKVRAWVRRISRRN